MNIFNYWWVWDILASEPVTDILSILSGYVAFCVVITTVLLAFSPVLWLARRSGRYETARKTAIATAVLLATLAFVLSMFGAHDLFNQYQGWYLTPLGPSI